MNAKDLKEEFKKETGRSIINDRGCHDVDYVGWLEKRSVKLCDIPHVSKQSKPLVAFMKYYKNNVPIGTQRSSLEIVKDYLATNGG